LQFKIWLLEITSSNKEQNVKKELKKWERNEGNKKEEETKQQYNNYCKKETVGFSMFC
jgi:hypothetical protein